jgi:menaquinone-dependent protoporphyrinogen oxidase
VSKNTKILIAYSSKYGQTRKIAQDFQIHLRDQEVVCLDLKASDPNPMDFDFILVLGSIHYGVHASHLREWTNKHSALLNLGNSGFISVNLVARSPQKAQAESNPYLQKFLTQSLWHPTLRWVLAGQLDYGRYPFWDRWMIRWIMKMSKGPCQGHEKIDYTDWQQIPLIAQEIQAWLKTHKSSLAS